MRSEQKAKDELTAGQSEQLVAPDVVEYLPFSQSEHEAELGPPEVLPAPQAVHEGGVPNVPGGHTHDPGPTAPLDRVVEVPGQSVHPTTPGVGS